MPVPASILLALALILAVLFGPNFETHLWGPALVALGLAALAASPAGVRATGRPMEPAILIPALLTAAWFAWRASVSPVPDLALTDGLLLAAALIGFLVTRTAESRPAAGKTLLWALALLLLASIAVVFKQLSQPDFTVLFRSKPDTLPSGFFGHYSFGGHFLAAASLLLAGAATLGPHPAWTRILWGAIAAGGLIAVFLTKSRGAYIGAGAGLIAWTVVLTLVGLRRKTKWAAPATLILPVLAILLVAGFIAGLSFAHEQRLESGGVTGMMDNHIRLYFLGIAASCIALHPVAGGGSRSFSWECHRFWDPANHGYGNNLPEHVHNELVQAATDYGLIGAALIIALLLAITISALLRSWLDASPDSSLSDGWRLGGLAALTAILAHSAFEGVFRTLPGALMLGITLAACCHSASPPSPAPVPRLRRWIPSLALLATSIWLLPHAWNASLAAKSLWPTHHGKSDHSSDNAKIQSLTAALDHWPTAALFLDRAATYQRLSAADGRPPALDDRVPLAIADYRRAATLHPYSATPTINLANLLSLSGDEAAAETQYARTLHLQGGMEAAYFGRWHLSRHLLTKGLRQFQNGQLNQAAATLQWAATEAEESNRLIPGSGKLEQRITIHESLGTALEAIEDLPGALAAYNHAATIPGGLRAHYRAAALLASRGQSLWSKRRPGEALHLFNEALRRVQSAASLPAGVTEADRAALLNKLKNDIEFLQTANIQPVPPKDD